VPRGAAISVIAPASYAQKERVELGVAALRALGFEARISEQAALRGPLYFAGTREQRLEDLHAAFSDPETQIVMSVRGGYGSNYLLDGIDLDLLRAHPKPFFAYSDLTGIQSHLLDRIGLPVFHGPMLAADFYLESGVHKASFDAALAGEPYSAGAAEGLRILRPGDARGILYGGCLSILVALLGTRWEPATEGKLLFLEDTGARPHQVDRMLWQLRAAGKLDGVPGIVFGEMYQCAAPGADPDLIEKSILSALHGFDGPIAFGLRSGHVSRECVTLTFGVEASLSAGDEAELRMLEPVVRT
jgi:muramoyltetrapeptide carboxypeptidase